MGAVEPVVAVVAAEEVRQSPLVLASGGPAEDFIDIGTIRGKAVLPPTTYQYGDGPLAYKGWRERLRAYLKVQFPRVPWDPILSECERRRQRIIIDQDVVELLRSQKIRLEDQGAIESGLYLIMGQSLKGATLERVTTAISRNILDQYRAIYFEGMSISELALFNAKGRLWRVDEAKFYKELPSIVEKWESERNFFTDHAELIMSEDDQKFNLLMLAPREMRREVLKECTMTRFPSYTQKRF